MTQAAYRLAPFSEPLSVPRALLSRRNWIGWKAVPEPGKLKPKKLPVCIRTGSPDGYTLPENHVSYGEATAAMERLKLSGVGFVMTPDCGLIGVDMDGCRDPATGVIEPRAQAIIDRRETYFEISPSGEGVRFWALTDVPLRESVVSKAAGVEMYSTGRYLTFTGDRIVGTPLEVGRAPYAIETLMRRAADAKAAGALATPVSGGGPGGAQAPDLDEAFRRKVYQASPMGKINQAALGRLGEWVPELFPAASHQPGTGAWRVKSADLGRGLEEDLSLSPEGIVDFGVHDLGDPREGKRTPIDVVMEWSDTKPRMDAAEAAEWLAAKLGLPFDSGSGSSPGPDAGAGAVQETPFVTFNPAIFVGRTPPTRRWIVPDWVPYGAVTGFYGDGGTGKSLLMMQLQASTAAGKPWLGLAVDQVKSLGIYCEDEPDELWRRQEAINAAMFCTYPDVADAEMSSRLGEDNLLMVFGRSGRGELTKFYGQVLEKALDLGVRLVVVDTAADTFGGSELDRGQVRQFVQRALGGLALKLDGAVVCCAHPSKAGLKEDTGDSGSTGWSNAFRSRAFLSHDEVDPMARTLRRMKANYAPRSATFDLRWSAGVLGLAQGTGGAGTPTRDVLDVFLDLMRVCKGAGRNMSLSPNAPGYAPRVFAGMDRMMRDGYQREDFRRAMETALASGIIVNVEYVVSRGVRAWRLEEVLTNSLVGGSPF